MPQKVKTEFLQYYEMLYYTWQVFCVFFFCYFFSFFATWLTEILETKIFICSFQCPYIKYTLYFICINESLMTLWLVYIYRWLLRSNLLLILFLGLMVFNATFNNISVISWQSVLLVEETGVSGENHQPATSHWQTLSYVQASTLTFFFNLSLRTTN